MNHSIFDRMEFDIRSTGSYGDDEKEFPELQTDIYDSLFGFKAPLPIKKEDDNDN